MEVVGTVFSIFILLFIGYGAKKVGLLKAEHAEILNTVVIYFTLPAYIFDAIYSHREPLPMDMVKIPGVGFAMIALVMAIAYVMGRWMKLDRPTIGGFMIAAGFGNTGFLGYPVVQATFGRGEPLIAAVLYDEIAMAIPLWTVGTALIAGFAGQRVNAKQMLRVLTLPGILAIPIALILRPFILPEPFLDVVRYLGAGTIPLVMISLGLSLSARSFKGYTVPIASLCLLKLAILPILTYYALKFTGVSGVIQQVTVLEAAMPSAVMTAVIAAKFGGNAKFVAAGIFVTTLLSIATIPLILIILGV